MSVSQDELMHLQSQLEGLESIFFELIPFGVELKRQQVQDYYDKRFNAATKPHAPVANNELRRQFNTKANQVRNLVDSAESLGDVGNKVNLIRAAAGVPSSSSKIPKEPVLQFSRGLINERKVDPDLLNTVTSDQELSEVDARVLLASTLFLAANDVEFGGKRLEVKELLGQIVGIVRSEQLLTRNDPFLIEAQCSLESMENPESE